MLTRSSAQCSRSIEIILDKLPRHKIGRPEINGGFLCGKIWPKLLLGPTLQKQSAVKFKKLPLSLFLSRQIDHCRRILSYQYFFCFKTLGFFVLILVACSTICDGWFSWSPICLLQDSVFCLLDKVHYIKVGLKVMWSLIISANQIYINWTHSEVHRKKLIIEVISC